MRGLALLALAQCSPTCWGSAYGGGDCRGLALANVTAVAASSWAFAALRTDGTVRPILRLHCSVQRF